MNCEKLHSDIEKLKSLRDEFASQLEAANDSGRGKIALSALSNEASNAADEILEHYANDIIEQDEKDEEHPNIEFIKTLKERLGYITDDTTIDQIRNNIVRYLENDLGLSSNLLTYALKEKSVNQNELDAIFQQLNLEPDKISEIMERIKNLEVLETENYIFMLPKDKWEEGKIKIPNPGNYSRVPEYIAPNDLTAILKNPVYYDWNYETNGRKTEYDGDARTLVYYGKWVGKEIRHFPWSKELIEQANEKLLKPNGYIIPPDWNVIVESGLRIQLSEGQGIFPETVTKAQLAAALQERLGLALSGCVWTNDLLNVGRDGYFWTASDASADKAAYCLELHSDFRPPYSPVDLRGHGIRSDALSVRCVSES